MKSSFSSSDGNYAKEATEAIRDNLSSSIHRLPGNYDWVAALDDRTGEFIYNAYSFPASAFVGIPLPVLK